MGKQLKVPIADIEIGERRREDLGNIKALADSIRNLTLLHPIVLSEGILVAGFRRLRACQAIGYTEIDAIDLGPLDERTRALIELDENLKRKNYTDYEQSKALVRQVEGPGEPEPELLPHCGSNSAPKRGRPHDAGSVVAKTKKANIPRATYQKAKAHTEAVEKYPKLIDEPQSTAIKAAAALDELPEPERQEVLAQPEPAKAAVEAIRELPSVQQANLLKQWAAEVSRTRDGLMLLPLDEIVPLLDQDKTESARRFRADLRNWTDRLEARLAKASQFRIVGGSS